MADIRAFIERYLAEYTPYKHYWNYEDGCVLKGCIDLYGATGDVQYKTFVLNYLDKLVAEDGMILNYDQRGPSIDSFNCSKALFFALEQTGEERYRRAIDFCIGHLFAHPRCICGNFIHKAIHPDQIWLDGLYMAQPFYMAYEMKFGKMEKVSDITDQFKNVRRLMYKEEKGLYVHGYDEAGKQPWADENGCSESFWLRSMGWYLMALVDCAQLCSEQLYEHYRTLVDIFREAMRGVLRWQDEETGLFYQIIDQPQLEGNYLESSGSAMIAYALLKGIRLGLLDDEKYLPVALQIFEGLVKEKLVTDGEGSVHMTDICVMASLGADGRHDGSAAYYLSEPRVCDDSKGVGPLMMALSEYLMRTGG